MTISAEGLPSSGQEPRPKKTDPDLRVDSAAYPSAPIQKASCGAVVTAFLPSAELRSAVAGMLEQFSSVVIVDDGAGDENGVLESCRGLGAHVLHLEANSGIGAALNAGIAATVSSHPDVSYVVTFDQDSVPPRAMLDRFEAARTAALAAGLRVGSVSPESVSGSRVLTDHRKRGFSEVREPIQSGMLVPMDVINAIGGFDEGLFIDGVDTDFYWKLRGAGLAAVAAPGVALEHTLGSRTQARLLGRPLILPSGPFMLMQSAPFRYYYLGRNRVHLLRRYAATRPAPMLRGLSLDIRHVAVVAVLGTERRKRLTYYLRGIRDGLLGRTGKIRKTP